MIGTIAYIQKLCHEFNIKQNFQEIIHTDGMTAVIPTDNPKSVRNRCVIEVFDGVFYVVTMLFFIFLWL